MSSLRTKEVIEPKFIYSEIPKITNVRKDMEMDFSRIYKKPYLIGVEGWSTTDPAGATLSALSLPSSIMTNTTAKVPFEVSCLYRLNGCIMVQASGTVQHQGLLLVAVVPIDAQELHINQLLMAPHAFINANESTSVCVEMPYYSNNALNRTSTAPTSIMSDNEPDYMKVVFYVLSPLRTTATGSTTITISIHVKLDNSEFYIPKVTPGTYGPQSFMSELAQIPTNIFDGLTSGAKQITGDFIDTLRRGLRRFTGFHYPNSTVINKRVITTAVNFLNNIDQPSLLEKLDPYGKHDRIVRDYQFNTAQDEMDMSFLLSKPVWLGKFGVNTNTATGKVLFNIPISPMVEFQNLNYFSPMRLAYESTRYWRGSLKLHIQAVSTNFHFTKILVAKDYTGSLSSNSLTLDMNSVHNMPTDTLEFSGGGQIQTIELPFCAQNEQLECTRDPLWNGFQHGIVHGYLLQPLITNGTVPTAIEFHVYMSAGDDFQFYGYSTDPIVDLNSEARLSAINKELAADLALPKPKSNYKKSKFLTKSQLKHDKDFQDGMNRARQMTTQAGEANVMLESGDQESVNNTIENTDSSLLRCIDFQPIVSVRDFVRRMQLVDVYVTQSTPPHTVVYPVTDIFSTDSSFGCFSKLYHGMTGGVRLRFELITTSATATPLLKYVPPGSYCMMSDVTPFRTTPESFLGLIEETKVSLKTTMRVDLPCNITPLTGNRTKYTYEFTLPNMNPKRFITPGALDTRGDLGTVLFTTNTPVNTPVILKIYAGLADEARLGFQVVTPGFAVPTTGGYRETLFGEGSPQPFNPLMFPGLYYFNPTT